MKYRLFEYSLATNNKSKKSIHIVQLFFDSHNKHSLIYPDSRTTLRKLKKYIALIATDYKTDINIS